MTGMMKLLGEIKVALIVRRHRHDGARAVIGQNIVRDPDRRRGTVDGIARVGAGEHAGFFAPFRRARDAGQFFRGGAIRGHSGARRRRT